jgi:hypothetical protein
MPGSSTADVSVASAAARALDEAGVGLAAQAHVRPRDTRYDARQPSRRLVLEMYAYARQAALPVGLPSWEHPEHVHDSVLHVRLEPHAPVTDTQSILGWCDACNRTTSPCG